MADGATVDDGRLVLTGEHPFLMGVDLGRPTDVDAAVAAAATAGFRLLRIDDDQPVGPISDVGHTHGLLVCRSLPRRLAHEFRPGWERGDERDLPDLLRRRPRRSGFPVGTGAPSASGSPAALARLVERGWPDVAALHGEDAACFARHTPQRSVDDVGTWARATRNYQAMVVRFAIEAFRRNQTGGTRGFVIDRLADGPDDVIGPGLLDHEGTPKEAYLAATAACRPLLPIADRLPPHLHGGEQFPIDLHVLDDRAGTPSGEPIRVEAAVRWADGGRTWQLDGHTRGRVNLIGALQLTVPAVSGPLVLDVAVHHADGPPVSSSYRSDIYADPHDH